MSLLARVRRPSTVKGQLWAPGDKSLSHRALILGSLSPSSCLLTNLAPGADVRSTARCLQALGATIEVGPDQALVTGPTQWRSPSTPLDCGNSGTTIRLLSGVVAGADLEVTLTGDESLRGRPMRRVLGPLARMGALAHGQQDEFAPLEFRRRGCALQGVHHELAVASAQVKSCILLAGLFADGVTSVREVSDSRDHTERMLRSMGAPLEVGAHRVLSIRRPTHPLVLPERLNIPGDPSSAAFILGAALLHPLGEVKVEHVNTNPTRLGFLRVLERMGARVQLESTGTNAGEPVGHLHALGGRELQATDITPAEVPSLVDEIPLLAVLATQARGTTTLRGAAELRVKESDRLAQIASGLGRMGAQVEELPDGLIIHGPSALTGTHIEAARDHRIAMAFTVAGLVAKEETTISGAEWADISFPRFFSLMTQMTEGAVSTEGNHTSHG